MKLQLPSERNWQIYCEVQQEGRSLRAVAESYGVSPARVGEVVQQVQRFVAAAAPVEGNDPQRQALLALKIHETRSDLAYRRLMERFEALDSNDSIPPSAAIRFLQAALRASETQFRATLAYWKASASVRGKQPVEAESQATAPTPEAPIEPPASVLALEPEPAEVFPVVDQVVKSGEAAAYADPSPLPSVAVALETAPWRAEPLVRERPLSRKDRKKALRRALARKG